MFNKATLVGRLARDPEYRTFTNGGSVCKIRLLTSRHWRDRDSGEIREKVEGHNVSVYVNSLARRISENCRKGDMLLVEGPMESRSWEAGGERRSITEIAIRPYQGTVRRLPLGGRNNAPAAQPTSPDAAVTDPVAAILAGASGDLDEMPQDAEDVFDDWVTEDLESFGSDIFEDDGSALF